MIFVKRNPLHLRLLYTSNAPRYVLFHLPLAQPTWSSTQSGYPLWSAICCGYCFVIRILVDGLYKHREIEFTNQLMTGLSPWAACLSWAVAMVICCLILMRAAILKQVPLFCNFFIHVFCKLRSFVLSLVWHTYPLWVLIDLYLH